MAVVIERHTKAAIVGEKILQAGRRLSPLKTNTIAYQKLCLRDVEWQVCKAANRLAAAAASSVADAAAAADRPLVFVKFKKFVVAPFVL